VLALRAARAWGVPPTTYLRDWSTRDRGLAEGLLLHEAGIGPHGIPLRIATDPDMDGWFDVEERVDYAQAALDQWRAEQKDPIPGTYPVLVNLRNTPRTDDD
jgi:hypothetical protein